MSDFKWLPLSKFADVSIWDVFFMLKNESGEYFWLYWKYQCKGYTQYLYSKWTKKLFKKYIFINCILKWLYLNLYNHTMRHSWREPKSAISIYSIHMATHDFFCCDAYARYLCVCQAASFQVRRQFHHKHAWKRIFTSLCDVKNQLRKVGCFTFV